VVGVVALGVVAAEVDDGTGVNVDPVVSVVVVSLGDFLAGASEARIWSACSMKLCQMIAG
jgi:hypothetical protein